MAKKKYVIINRVALSILIIIALLTFGKDMLGRVLFEKTVKAITGLRVITEDFKIGVIKSNVDINEILILNPKGYADRIMFDMPVIYIDFNIPDLLKKKAHLKEMRVDVKEFTVINRPSRNSLF